MTRRGALEHLYSTVRGLEDRIALYPVSAALAAVRDADDSDVLLELTPAEAEVVWEALGVAAREALQPAQWTETAVGVRARVADRFLRSTTTSEQTGA